MNWPAMADIGFTDLMLVYENTTFAADGRTGTLTIADEGVLRLVLMLDDETIAADTGIVLLNELSDARVGAKVEVVCNRPKAAIGILAKDFDALLSWPPARIAESAAFYVISGRYGPHTQPVPAELAAYRDALRLIPLLGEAAAFLDPTRRELMFIKDGQVPVPLTYDKAAILSFDRLQVAALSALFSQDVHREQKLTILADAVVSLVSTRPRDDRFSFLLQNLATVVDQVRAGYRLFASEFSYEKIRSDVEDARLDYLNKIHKTFTDIQGQLLGLPVATVVVASQLKSSKACGVELWTNVAVLGGAWIFVMLLWVSVANQRLTLRTISDEVARQKGRMERDYASIADQFTDVFKALRTRIRWHKFGLGIVTFIGLAGAAFATFAFAELDTVMPWACVATVKNVAGETPGPPPNGADNQGHASTQEPARSIHRDEVSPRKSTPRRDE